MDDAEDGLEDFLELLEPEREPDLDRVALVFARAVEYPALDVDAYLARLDRMAEELRPRISPEEPPGRVVARINEYLFGEQGFRGNELEYYDMRRDRYQLKNAVRRLTATSTERLHTRVEALAGCRGGVDCWRAAGGG